MKYLYETFIIIITLFTITALLLSYKYEHLLTGKKILKKLTDKTQKQKYITQQRITLLLFLIIELLSIFAPTDTRSCFISFSVLIILIRGACINKKYLDHWNIRP